jgi:tripartite-type tricarboxylate transporter receptor subunit TctC
MYARHVIGAAIAALGLATQPVQAQESAESYPSHPIRFIVPFGPGGGPDIIARRLALGLSDRAKQPVVVDNKPGATGLIGVQELARSAPDGYTIATINLGVLVAQLLSPGTQVNLVRDTSAVAMPFRQYTVLLVAPSLPAHNVKELVDYLKARPNSFFGSGGNGTPAHLAGEIFRRSAGFNATHVPYKQLTTALSDVIRGDIQYIFSIGSSAVPMAQSGRLRALAVAAPKRLAVLPDVPTMAESGFADPDVNSWSGIVAPPGTPAPIVQKLNRLMREVVHDPVHGKAFEALGLEIADPTPEQFAALLRSESLRWARFVKEAHITLD